ncbi:MAG: hypothetical protein KGJ60_07570 [Verrucomicrobiota bacterium]|nr:hypothetical protein [Verrucomicrobiota bacterium]
MGKQIGFSTGLRQSIAERKSIGRMRSAAAKQHTCVRSIRKTDRPTQDKPTSRKVEPSNFVLKRF